ncbi:MAG: hypothetical protein J3Q66DRAFT_110736 [Benniella sp.]|nr:MAG: hypothetical protein J3Q66DRAFT_110736 [Benniella sp.]
MDIPSGVPVEIACQIFSKLEIQDLASCQQVCRQWYWILMDQSIWRSVYAEHEREFAIPTQPLSTSSYSVVPTTPSISPLVAPTLSKDWKQECRTRVISDRNWANGHIQSLYTLNVHRGGIVRLRVKSGKLLSGDMFGQVAMWDTSTYRCEDLFDAAVGPIQLLDFSVAAMIMTVISKSGVCRIWNLRTKALIHSWSAIDVVCMTMNDEYLILGKKDCHIQIVDFTTGETLKFTQELAGETLQDIYVQNDTLIVATTRFIRILSIDTLEVLLSSPLPISNNVRTHCSVFHIRSLILLTDKHLLHVQWEPLYSSPNKRFTIDTRRELPPNLLRSPFIHKTVVPPISTITSIAIGGNRPHVLTTNADRSSLNEAIRICPTTSRYSVSRSNETHPQAQQQQPSEQNTEDNGVDAAQEETPEIIGEGTEVMTSEDRGIVLTSQVEEISQYLETCGLKPSFMDVDEDVVVIGTSKGDIVVLSMAPPQE